jgi:hypothetical protein
MEEDEKADGRRRQQIGPSIAEASALLAVSEASMRRAVARGEVAALKFAGVWRILPREIDRLKRAAAAA